MKQPTFLEGVALALAASVAGSLLYSVLTSIFPAGPVLRALIAALGLVYVLYLLKRSRERVGRVSAVTLWLLAAVTTWWLAPSLGVYVLVHLALVWLIRSLYFYSSVLCALADLGLQGLSLAAAIWAVSQTGSLLLSLWCFFLTQSLFVAIPTSLRRPARPGQSSQAEVDRFQEAERIAQAALRKLSSVQ